MSRSIAISKNSRKAYSIRMLAEGFTSINFRLLVIGSIVIKWGDGTSDSVSNSVQTNVDFDHQYSSESNRWITIEGDTRGIRRIQGRSNNTGSLKSLHLFIGTFFDTQFSNGIDDGNPAILSFDFDWSLLSDSITGLDLTLSSGQRDHHIRNFDLTDFANRFPNLTLIRFYRLGSSEDYVYGDFSSLPPNLTFVDIRNFSSALTSTSQPVLQGNSLTYVSILQLKSVTWLLEGFNRPNGQLPNILILSLADNTASIIGSWNNANVPSADAGVYLYDLRGISGSASLSIDGDFAAFLNRHDLGAEFNDIRIRHNHGASTGDFNSIDHSKIISWDEFTIKDCPLMALTGAVASGNPFSTCNLFEIENCPSVAMTGNISFFRNCKTVIIDDSTQTNFNSFSMPIGQSWRSDLERVELRGVGGVGPSATQTDSFIMSVENDTVGPVILIIRSQGRTFLSDGAVDNIENRGGSVTLI